MIELIIIVIISQDHQKGFEDGGDGDDQDVMSIFGIVIGGWGLFVHPSFDQLCFIKYTWDSAGFR